jgi:hypothetical protein
MPRIRGPKCPAQPNPITLTPRSPVPVHPRKGENLAASAAVGAVKE